MHVGIPQVQGNSHGRRSRGRPISLRYEHSAVSVCVSRVAGYRISAPAAANPESGHFSEIRPRPALTKFLTGFAGFDRMMLV